MDSLNLRILLLLEKENPMGYFEMSKRIKDSDDTVVRDRVEGLLHDERAYIVGGRNNASISEAGKHYLANYRLTWFPVITLAPVAPPTGQVVGSILKNGSVSLPDMVEVIFGTIAKTYSNVVTIGTAMGAIQLGSIIGSQRLAAVSQNNQDITRSGALPF